MRLVLSDTGLETCTGNDVLLGQGVVTGECREPESQANKNDETLQGETSSSHTFVRKSSPVYCAIFTVQMENVDGNIRSLPPIIVTFCHGVDRIGSDRQWTRRISAFRENRYF